MSQNSQALPSFQSIQSLPGDFWFTGSPASDCVEKSDDGNLGNTYLISSSIPENGDSRDVVVEGLEGYSQRYKCREEEVECPVCLSVIEEEEEIRELRCEHLFHRDCLDRWVGYSRHVNCPLCRGSLFPCTTVLLGDENGVEVLFFKYSSFSSSRDHRDTWWLR